MYENTKCSKPMVKITDIKSVAGIYSIADKYHSNMINNE